MCSACYRLYRYLKKIYDHLKTCRFCWGFQIFTTVIRCYWWRVHWKLTRWYSITWRRHGWWRMVNKQTTFRFSLVLWSDSWWKSNQRAIEMWKVMLNDLLHFSGTTDLRTPKCFILLIACSTWMHREAICLPLTISLFHFWMVAR